MAPSTEGWIKLHRQALGNGWLQNHRLWAFLCYCLLKASHKATTATVGYQRVALEAGQFVFGRQQAAADLAMTERQVRTCLTRLISTGNLTIKATNKFSVVTVVNWHSYQDTTTKGDQENDRQLDQEVTSKRPASDHIQEWKELKNIRKNPSSPEAFRLSGVLADLIQENNPCNTNLNNRKRDATVARWAADVDRLIRLDGKSPEEIERVIRWSQRDSFWKSNILSGVKLREKWNQLTVKMQGSRRDEAAEADRYGMFKGAM